MIVNVYGLMKNKKSGEMTHKNNLNKLKTIFMEVWEKHKGKDCKKM